MEKCQTTSFTNTFLPMTSRNWNSLPASVFHVTFNLQTFNNRVHKHLRPSTLSLQFHFNRFNCVEKIVDEKNDNIHPSIHPHALNKKNRTFWPLDETPCNFWQNRHVLKLNLIEYFNWDHGFRSLYLRTLWSRSCHETDYNTFPMLRIGQSKNYLGLHIKYTY